MCDSIKIQIFRKLNPAHIISFDFVAEPTSQPPAADIEPCSISIALFVSFPFGKPKCWRLAGSPSPPPPPLLLSSAAASLCRPNPRPLRRRPSRGRERGPAARWRSRCWGWPAPSRPAPSATSLCFSPAPGRALESRGALHSVFAFLVMLVFGISTPLNVWVCKPLF